jgi:hypothetical protein
MRDDMVDYLSACHGKAAYKTRDMANRALRHTMRKGGVGKGFRLHVFKCRHVDADVYHVGSSMNHSRTRTRYKD